MEVIMNTKSTIVIGGGLSGLTAAIYLARGGKNVLLIEKSNELGGRARTQVSNGYYFNLGPHALYAAGAASAILKELKIPFNGQIPTPKSVALIADSSGKFSGIFQLP